jgi:hypothetical protein
MPLGGSERMCWEAVGVLGEWAGAVAVTATLVYLAIQVRHRILDFAVEQSGREATSN